MTEEQEPTSTPPPQTTKRRSNGAIWLKAGLAVGIGAIVGLLSFSTVNQLIILDNQSKITSNQDILVSNQVDAIIDNQRIIIEEVANTLLDNQLITIDNLGEVAKVVTHLSTKQLVTTHENQQVLDRAIEELSDLTLSYTQYLEGRIVYFGLLDVFGCRNLEPFLEWYEDWKEDGQPGC